MPPRTLRLLLAPLLVWTVHFFGGYGLALALPTSALLDPLIVALTILAEAVLIWLWQIALGLARHRAIARKAIAIAAIAVAWQGLVVLF
ncbi:MAG: hypothetical protein M3Q88_01725 [Pseudomonadota bacterium]|nr:hypothetical protein [Pseudomonadota bacterium]